MAEVVVRLKGREVQRHKIAKSITLVGRDPRNDLVIDNTTVSRRHAFIQYKEGAFWVKDAGAANGITLNDGPVGDGRFRPGDELMVGKFVLSLDWDGKPVDLFANSQEFMETYDGTERTTHMTPEELKRVAGNLDADAGAQRSKRTMIMIAGAVVALAVIGGAAFFLLQ